MQNCGGFNFQYILDSMYMGRLNEKFWTSFHIEIQQHITKLNEYITLLEQLVNHVPNIPQFDTYPIIMVCHNQSLLTEYCNEYRPTRNLRIGTDITQMLTDTPQNANKLKAFLSSHNITCDVQLI